MSAQPNLIEKFGKFLKESHLSIFKSTLIAFTKFELTEEEDAEFKKILASYENAMDELIKDIANEYNETKQIEPVIDKLLAKGKEILEHYNSQVEELRKIISKTREERARLERDRVVREARSTLAQYNISISYETLERIPTEILKEFVSKIIAEAPLPQSTIAKMARERGSITFPLMVGALPSERAAIVKNILGVKEEDYKDYLREFGSPDYNIIARNIHRLRVYDPVSRTPVDVPSSKIPSEIRGVLYNIYIQGKRFVIRFNAIGMPPELSDLFLEIGDAEITLYKK